MRLPTRTPAACASPARRASGTLLLLALSLCAAPALATHYVVDMNGGGDFTTIQAAIDARTVAYRDTILVLPGAYPESPSLTPQACCVPSNTHTYLVGTGGPGATTVQGIVLVASPQILTHIEGLTFTGNLTLVNYNTGLFQFRQCTFLGTLFSDANSTRANFSDCDFWAPTRLERYYERFTGLRFHGAPLTITHAPGAGSFVMQDCTFEGPADTLVYMPWANYDYGGFERCTFSDANHGLVYGPDCINITFPITACVFRDLTGTAIATADTAPIPNGTRRARLSVVDSRFERCGTAVRWVHSWRSNVQLNHGAELLRDTVLASTGDAVVLGPQDGDGLTDTIVDGSGGHGLLCLQSYPAQDYQLNPANLHVTNSRFTNNALDGVCIRDTVPGVWPHYPYVPLGFAGPKVSGSTFAGNGGAGLRIVASMWNVHHCVAFANQGDGLALTNVSPAFSPITVSNTSALNFGDGFRMEVIGTPLDTVHLVRQNLAVLNAGAGFRTPLAGVGSIAFNDAWSNYAGQFVGGPSSLDSNLTVDPRFCDLGAGDLGLQQGSPCGAGGVYGLIGALPESCPNTLAVEPPAPGALAFAVRPSVARGSVEFVPPASGAEGRVELFDVAGRVVWRAPLGPASGVVRWRGEGDRGRVSAGLYWARFTRGSERATQRLVWLE